MTALSEDPSGKPASLPRLAIPLLSVAGFAVSVSTRVTDPLVPYFSAEFGVSLVVAATTVTSFALAYGVAQLFFGPLGDRYGKYFMIAVMCLASSLTAMLCAVSIDLSFLVWARFAAGLTAAAVIPLAMAWIGDVVPYDERQTALARFMVGQMSGLSAGAFVGGGIAESLNWRWIFVGISVLFLVAGCMLVHLGRRLPAHAKAVSTSRKPSFWAPLREFAKVTNVPWARFVLLAVYLEGAFVFASLAFIPTFMVRTFGSSTAVSGAVLMLFGFGGLFFVVFAGRLVRALGERGMATLGGGTVAVSVMAVAITPSWWPVIGFCFFLGMGFYILHNTLQTNATQMAPERRGAAVSAFAASFYLGQATGVGLGGWMLEQSGARVLFAASGVGMVVLTLLWGWRLAARAKGSRNFSST